MDVGKNTVFPLCSVEAFVVLVVSEDAGFSKDRLVITGENDVTVTLPTVVEDFPMLTSVLSEVLVRFTDDV